MMWIRQRDLDQGIRIITGWVVDAVCRELIPDQMPPRNPTDVAPVLGQERGDIQRRAVRLTKIHKGEGPFEPKRTVLGAIAARKAAEAKDEPGPQDATADEPGHTSSVQLNDGVLLKIAGKVKRNGVLAGSISIPVHHITGWAVHGVITADHQPVRWLAINTVDGSEWTCTDTEQGIGLILAQLGKLWWGAK